MSFKLVSPGHDQFWVKNLETVKTEKPDGYSLYTAETVEMRDPLGPYDPKECLVTLEAGTKVLLNYSGIKYYIDGVPHFQVNWHNVIATDETEE